MKIEKVVTEDFLPVANFIASINNKPETFCLHCGETAEIILNDMKAMHGRNELRLFKIEINKQILAIIGGECSEDETRFWLWGPFIHQSLKWLETADKLYDFLWQTFPNLKQLYVYNHEKNTQSHEFYITKKFVPKGENIFLYELKKEYVKQPIKSSEIEIVNFSKPYFQSLDKLHNRLFPNTYYTTQEMIDLDKEANKIFIIPNTTTQVAAYILANLEAEGGYIHFVGTQETERKKGYATALMQNAINWLINEKQVKEIFLTVTESNNAKFLYKKLGFQLKYTGVAAKLLIEI